MALAFDFCVFKHYANGGRNGVRSALQAVPMARQSENE